MWAEKFGIGEMDLKPDVFWSLTVREFWIKHDAFRRAEDRMRSLMIEHVSLTSPRKKKADQNDVSRMANMLRRYPVKPWLMED